MRGTANQFASGSLRINVFYFKGWKIRLRDFWSGSFSFGIAGIHSNSSRIGIAAAIALSSAIANVNNVLHQAGASSLSIATVAFLGVSRSRSILVVLLKTAFWKARFWLGTQVSQLWQLSHKFLLHPHLTRLRLPI